MKLATLIDGSRDGRLSVVNRAGTHLLSAEEVAPSLQRALDDWEVCAPKLVALARRLERDPAAAEPLDARRLLAPLPRAYEWVDGSAYINHILLARRARNAEPPATLRTEPLVYQGGSSVLLGARAAIALPNSEWGLDFEAEVCVVLGDVPRGLAANQAAPTIRLLMLANDLSYRNLIPGELAKGFGFFNSKPATAFSPFAVTPDELGPAWRDGRLHLAMHCHVNGRQVGSPNAGIGMHFSFHELIAHIAKTRDFSAGTILGSGTVSNADARAGVACLVERRCREILEGGAPITPFLGVGDSIRIEMYDADGQNVFGSIEQEVIAA
jgi:fumarylacetoacetate (FAA) hydrolase